MSVWKKLCENRDDASKNRGSDWAIVIPRDVFDKIRDVVNAATGANTILKQVAKATHIDWEDDCTNEPYGLEASLVLDVALEELGVFDEKIE